MARWLPFPAACLALAAGGLHAQDETNLWVRHALRAPLGEAWTWHSEPDFRTRIEPSTGAFTQWLFRNDLQRRLSEVNTLGIGFVWLHTTFQGGAPPVSEWRPQLTLFTRPNLGQRDLLLRARVEWRQQHWRGSDGLPEAQGATLRCRAMAQYDLALARAPWGMSKGLRASAELLMRGYTDTDLGPYDHLRLSMAAVATVLGNVELEATWMWMFRDTGTVQQWLRLGAVHRLARKANDPAS